MTNEQRAEKLRRLADEAISSTVKMTLREMADDMSPPKPDTGTIVWWRPIYADEDWWELGKVSGDGVWPFNGNKRRWSDIKWKPANIPETDKMIIEAPPVDEWPEKADNMVLTFTRNDFDRTIWLTAYNVVNMTREEAKEIKR